MLIESTRIDVVFDVVVQSMFEGAGKSLAGQVDLEHEIGLVDLTVPRHGVPPWRILPHLGDEWGFPTGSTAVNLLRVHSLSGLRHTFALTRAFSAGRKLIPVEEKGTAPK